MNLKFQGDRKIFVCSCFISLRLHQGILQGDGHALCLGVECQCCLAKFAAQATLLIPTEGAGHIEDVPAVDPHSAGLQEGGCLHDRVDVVAEDTRSKAEGGVVGTHVLCVDTTA
eukprot:TRINITY_DN3176_c0_g1_i6.p1 TRINITY_DN3176_c0_g1~~TRINITY_DN3176_c0_g1_i6.p1  ORF type:complete len:114 (+),score=0.43 TRINITY_DN3176_c0_g1_i6:122-463(+)